MATTGTGLKKETSAALAVLLGPTLVVPVLFILLEKDEFVKFWAFQSIVTVIAFWITFWAIGLFVFTIILAPIVAIANGLLMIAGLIVWLMSTYKAWQGERWEVPIIGKLAMQIMKKA